MENTLRKNVEKLLCRITDKIEILQKNINAYKDCDDFENENELWWAITNIGTYQDAKTAYNVTHWMSLPKSQKELLPSLQQTAISNSVVTPIKIKIKWKI